MSKLTNNIEELAEIGKELVKIGLEQYGRGWETLEDDIRVYTADSGNHQAFAIGHLKVAYFFPIQIEAQMSDLEKIPEYIQRAKDELARLNELVDGLSKEEIQAKKDAKIAQLKKELDELEAPEPVEEESKLLEGRI